MKKTLYIMSLTIALLFVGCGGGGGSDNDSSSTGSNSIPTTLTPSSETMLKVNVKTEVKSGEIYEARSSDALVDIEHNLVSNRRYITLIKGEGAILKN